MRPPSTAHLMHSAAVPCGVRVRRRAGLKRLPRHCRRRWQCRARMRRLQHHRRRHRPRGTGLARLPAPPPPMAAQSRAHAAPGAAAANGPPWRRCRCGRREITERRVRAHTGGVSPHAPCVRALTQAAAAAARADAACLRLPRPCCAQQQHRQLPDTRPALAGSAPRSGLPERARARRFSEARRTSRQQPPACAAGRQRRRAPPAPRRRSQALPVCRFGEVGSSRRGGACARVRRGLLSAHSPSRLARARRQRLVLLEGHLVAKRDARVDGGRHRVWGHEGAGVGSVLESRVPEVTHLRGPVRANPPPTAVTHAPAAPRQRHWARRSRPRPRRPAPRRARRPCGGSGPRAVPTAAARETRAG